jgi:hypothetical protein
MPRNGAALALVPDPAPLPPAQANITQANLEMAIGNAVADAALMVCTAAFGPGGLDRTVRAAAGNMFVRLYELQATNPGLDFNAVARRAGVWTLRDRYGAVLAQCGDEAALDAALAEVISWPLDILAKVTADEQAWQRAREQHGRPCN